MIPPVVVGGGGPVNVVVVGVMISLVVVGGGGVGVMISLVVVGGGGPANVVVTKVDGVLLVGVILVTDDETVTSVVGACDLSLPQETTYTIDAVTIRTTAGGPPPFATLRADALIDTTEPPKSVVMDKLIFPPPPLRLREKSKNPFRESRNTAAAAARGYVIRDALAETRIKISPIGLVP
jgi:hypothetical protein